MPLRLLTVAWTTAILSIAAVAPVAGAGVDIGTVLRKADFADIKISPDGDYFAATRSPSAGRTSSLNSATVRSTSVKVRSPNANWPIT